MAKSKKVVSFKAKKQKANAKAPKAAKSHQQLSANPEAITDEMRENFSAHRRTWLTLSSQQKSLDQKWKAAKAAIKSDGFQVQDMAIADDLGGTPKQEAKVYAAVKRRLLVAGLVGHPMGAQYDLFTQPDRTPAVDRAYDEGKQASIDNQACKPPYAPGTQQFQKWMHGYQDHQAVLTAQFKPLKSAAAEPNWGNGRDPARPLDA